MIKDCFERNPRRHFFFLVICLILSIAASFLAVFGAIYLKINYLAFMPISFLLFLACQMGLVVLQGSARQWNIDMGLVFSIEMSSVLFALFFAPIALYVVTAS